MDNNENNRCRICGRDQGEPPWGSDGKSAKGIICVCCGGESGYDDYSLEAGRKYRQNWMLSGGQWSDPEFKPENWSLEEQIKLVPLIFL